MTTKDELLSAGAGPEGGFTEAQLDMLGVSWPPRKGWTRRIKPMYTEHEHDEFVRLREVGARNKHQAIPQPQLF